MEKSEEYLKRYNAIVDYLDKNHDKIELEKINCDFERYKTIINYFNENKEDNEYLNGSLRVTKNRKYVKRLANFLEKAFFMDISDFDIDTIAHIKGEFQRLEDEVRNILKRDEQNLRGKLQFIEASREKKMPLVDQWLGMGESN